MSKRIFSGLTLPTLTLSIAIFCVHYHEASAVPADASPQAFGTTITYNFDKDAPGGMPAKFHAARTGQGGEGKWVVMADPAAVFILGSTLVDRNSVLIAAASLGILSLTKKVPEPVLILLAGLVGLLLLHGIR